MPKTKRFTIYDAMEEKGVFEANPANVNSRDSENLPLYKGPVEYPKMFYHPQGKRTIIVPGELESTVLGPRLRDQQSQLDWALAHSKEDEAKLRREGWHDSPAKAEAVAAGVELPATKEETIAAQEARIAELQAQLLQAKGREAAKGNHTGANAQTSKL